MKPATARQLWPARRNSGYCSWEIRGDGFPDQRVAMIEVWLRAHANAYPVRDAGPEFDTPVAPQLGSPFSDYASRESNVHFVGTIEVSDLPLANPNRWSRRECSLAERGTCDARAPSHEVETRVGHAPHNARSAGV